MNQPPGGPPPGGAPPPGGGAPPPNAGGMMTPQSPEGKIQGGRASLMALGNFAKTLLPQFQMGTEESKCTLKIITEIEKCIGKQSDEVQELMPAEIKQLMQGLAGPGAAPGGPPGGGPPGGGPPGGGPPQMQGA